jgi:hypothetical protein
VSPKKSTHLGKSASGAKKTAQLKIAQVVQKNQTHPIKRGWREKKAHSQKSVSDEIKTAHHQKAQVAGKNQFTTKKRKWREKLL